MKRLVVFGGKVHAVGGIETHLFQFCQSMIKRQLGLPLYLTSTQLALESKKTLVKLDVNLREFNCGGGLRGKWEYLRCLQTIWAERGDDVVFYSNGICGIAYLVNRLLRPSLWIHHHHADIQPDTAFSRLYDKVLANADCLIGCTPGQARILDDRYSRNGRSLFLPVLKAEPTTPVFPDRRDQNRDRLVVGFFGRLRESKGVRILLELGPWFQSQGMECRLHGDDCEGWLAQGVPAGVSWNGAYDAAKDMDRLMSAVDVVVLPTTFSEGLPIVLSEAISRGIPVVAYPGGGLREMASFHRGVIIVPPDVESLKAGLLQMQARLGEPSLGNSLAKKYQQELGNQKTLDWWDNLLSDGQLSQ
jgi:glycosyltransferase involved in cell wall biosynthesis